MVPRVGPELELELALAQALELAPGLELAPALELALELVLAPRKQQQCFPELVIPME